MLVVDVSQSIHRLLLLLFLGQCMTALLSETLLCEGKNQCTSTLLPPRICLFLPMKYSLCLLLFIHTAAVSTSVGQQKLLISHALGMSSMEEVNNRD